MDKHESIRRQLASLALGELPGQERSKILAHVGRCDPCREELTQIERLLDSAGKRKGLSADESLLASARDRLFAATRDENKAETTARARSRWVLLGRKIIRSRMTKLAAAIILVAAAILGIHSFNGTPVKAVEFSEITQAMREVPWMRMIPSGFTSEGSEIEQWFGFESKIHAVKWVGGDVSFESIGDHKRVTYQPDNNTVSIIYTEDTFDLDLTSPALWLESLHTMLKEQGGKITALGMGDYQGRRVQIQEISRSNDGQQTNLTLYIDPETTRLYAGKATRTNAAGKVVDDARLDFEYPASGPRDIYDLGVPRNAQIVDMMPSGNFKSVWDEYLRRKAELPNEYIAVVAHRKESLSDTVHTLDVNYKSGRKVRLERYHLPAGEVIAELGPQNREQLDHSLEPILAWARNRYKDTGQSVRIQLDDGRYHVSTFRNGGAWGELEELGGRAPTALGEAWPIITPVSQVIEDDYARQNGLICVEQLTQGKVIPDFGVSNPGRLLWYLDPAHDYLCRRHMMEWHPDADWQHDKDWLKDVDPSKVKVRGGSIHVCEIPEVFQASNGHWYPRVITEKEEYSDAGDDYRNGSLTVTDVQTIYLDVSPTFPEGIFDRDKLPK